MSSDLHDALANVQATYTALAMAIDGTQIVREPGFTLVTNPCEHPICNFAATDRIDPWSAADLARHAKKRPCLVVYRLSNETPERDDELLGRAGFCQTYLLSVFGAEGSNCESGLNLERIEGAAARDREAGFMCSAFFHRQPLEFRKIVRQATANATGLELLRYQSEGRLIAAMLLCDDACLGLYNLAVDSAWRGRGIGTKMVREALSLAKMQGKSLSLQCEPNLNGWYLERGFRKLGEIAVYKLPRSAVVI